MGFVTRSANAFLLLHDLSLKHPDLRPGQILAKLGVDVAAAVKSEGEDWKRFDPFYWEYGEWVERVEEME